MAVFVNCSDCLLEPKTIKVQECHQHTTDLQKWFKALIRHVMKRPDDEDLKRCFYCDYVIADLKLWRSVVCCDILLL